MAARNQKKASGTGISSVTSDPTGVSVRLVVDGDPWIVKFDPHACQMHIAPEDRESPQVASVPFRALTTLYQQAVGARVQPVRRPGIIIPS